MKHRRLAAAGLLALAVIFGATGAANATDDAPDPGGTVSCTVDGKEVTLTKAIPALPAKPGEAGDPAKPGLTITTAPEFGETGKLAGSATIVVPAPGEAGGPVELGEATAAVPAVPAVPVAALPSGETDIAMAQPSGPSFSVEGHESPTGVKITCVHSAAPESPVAPSE
ncbi:hypothetical protein [Herbidospora cretacea]|uniref:hypothetical protein n=1 Tax=Herbidospora cretacea TaxID=28444 RepID=UPI0012F8E219|nr:hypothetical protein [Herbidospora cretacea]